MYFLAALGKTVVLLFCVPLCERNSPDRMHDDSKAYVLSWNLVNYLFKLYGNKFNLVCQPETESCLLPVSSLSLTLTESSQII